jgi:phosphatidylserine/phosphatidylglycerophosphate/cardiolipin synthase-like enzyme
VRYRRALLLAEPGKDLAPVVSLVRRAAPSLEHLLVGVADAASLEAARRAAADAAASVEVQAAPKLGSDALAALCLAEEIDLVVFAARSWWSVSLVAVQRLQVAVLWADGASSEGPISKIGCVMLDDRSRVALGAFLRDHVERTVHVSVLTPTAVPSDVLETALEVSGVEAAVEISSPSDAPSMRQWLDEWTRHRALDLLVFARIPAALLLGSFWSLPVLLVPTLPSTRPFAQRAIDVADLVDDGGPLRVRIDQVATVSSLSPVPDQSFAFVSGGRVVATVATRAGEAELPAGLAAESFGVYRVGPPSDPLAAIEQQIAVVRPGEPLVLFDAELPLDRLRLLSSATRPVAVRLRPTRTCASIHKKLRAHGIAARVVDARAVLDEGEALDVSETLDGVRLERVAERLRRAGFSIAEVVPRVPVSASPPIDAEGEGNAIELELDNAKARGWLLDAIRSSRRTLHFQVYMAFDDDVGREVEAALAEAGSRGVAVRVLVDSLHGLHGSFGARNPLFERLSARPGVELRTVRPITELPSLEDLKQRDHRKLVVADGRVALLGGRNLAREYYTAFEEARITAASMWRDVPWLDAGARIEGPAVAAVERSFAEAWREAGGAPFSIEVPEPFEGGARARIVVHRGLRDARTLEAYLELIDGARAHVYVVNGFPLVLELQHALLRALRRGVRVRALIGHVTPTHEGHTFEGSWASARTFATELVHSRMDPIVEAGGEAFLFARRDVPGWEPGLGLVHPHVHAKAVSVDGARCAVGSANLDVTASYWESELLVVVEDETIARGFEAQIGARIAGSRPVRRDDPAWQHLAKRRAWMRHWPGVLSV